MVQVYLIESNATSEDSLLGDQHFLKKEVLV